MIIGKEKGIIFNSIFLPLSSEEQRKEARTNGEEVLGV